MSAFTLEEQEFLKRVKEAPELRAARNLATFLRANPVLKTMAEQINQAEDAHFAELLLRGDSAPPQTTARTRPHPLRPPGR